MKSGVIFAFGLTLVGCFSVAAYLVHDGHPWFATLIIAVTASISIKTGKES